MRRRDLLRIGAGSGLALTVGTALGAATVTTESRIPTATALQETETLDPLGRVSIDGAAEAVVGDDGDTVYVAATDGFATVDVSDPTAPTVLAERRALLDETEVDGTLTQILDVKVSGDRLAVVGPANPLPGGDVFDGVLLYDVSDPADPVLAADPYETEYSHHNASFDDDHLYLLGNDLAGNPLIVVDVSDDEFEEVGRWSLAEYDDRWEGVPEPIWNLHDVYVQDGVAYLSYWDGGTYLLDVSDPASPSYVSHVARTSVEDYLGSDRPTTQEAQLSLPGNDHYSAVDETGTLLAVGREAWSLEPGDPDGAGGIDLYDLSDPETPSEEPIASIEPPETDDASYTSDTWTTSHNFELREGRLYASWYQGGVTVHDVSDPEAPEPIASFRDDEVAAFWTARVVSSADGIFVGSSSDFLPGGGNPNGALYVFDTDAIRPENVDDGSDDDGSDDGSDDNGSADNGSDETDGEDDESDDESTDDDPTPGFTGAAGLTGGAIAIEWLRRRVSDGDA